MLPLWLQAKCKGQELASFWIKEKVWVIDVLDGASQEHTVANPIEQKKSGEPIAVFSKEANLEPDEFEKIMQVNQPGGSFEITLDNFVLQCTKRSIHRITHATQ